MNSFIKSNKLGLGLLILGLVFMGIGVFRGEVQVIFVKAIAICLECIGIG